MPKFTCSILKPLLVFIVYFTIFLHCNIGRLLGML